jgi:hypothetical protein
MTHLASGYGIAQWSPDRRETLLITDLTGNILDSHQVAPPGDRPRDDTLWPTLTEQEGCLLAAPSRRRGQPVSCYATWGVVPASFVIGRPAAAQPVMPSLMLTTSQPAPARATAACCDRLPARQIR